MATNRLLMHGLPPSKLQLIAVGNNFLNRHFLVRGDDAAQQTHLTPGKRLLSNPAPVAISIAGLREMTFFLPFCESG